MKIVLDMQGAQGGSRFRGIGRYTVSLAQAVLAENLAAPQPHDIRLLLSGLMPEGEAAVRAAFAGLLPPERILCLELPGPVAESARANAWRMQAAELLREHVLAGLRPDLVHVMSPCEGAGNEVVTSAGRLHAQLLTSAVLYDLIPLLLPDSYLAHPLVLRAYLRRMQALRQTALLLAISEASRRDAIARLDLPEHRVVSIGAGVDAFFRPVAPDAATLARYRLTRGVVLFSGGGEPRKNVARMLEAFALLPQTLRDRHQIGLIGSIPADEQRQIRTLARRSGIAGSLVFLGYVPDADLRQLYASCAAFVFPSLLEGFGLPALEAMACGAPVIGSGTSSIPEVIGRADALFDPTRPEQIAARLQAVLEDAGFAASLRESGVRTAGRFTWQACARRALAAWEGLHAAQPQAAVRSALPARPRLAFVAPLPPQPEGTAAARLLPELACRYDITCIVDQPVLDDPWVAANLPLRRASWFSAHHAGFDRVFYVIGAAAWPRALLADCPGVVQWGGAPEAGREARYEAYGYAALLPSPAAGAGWQVCPPLGAILERALRVLVTDAATPALVAAAYGAAAAEVLRVVPAQAPPPKVAAALCREIETAYAESGLALEPRLLRGIGRIGGLGIGRPTAGDLAKLAAAIVANRPPRLVRQMLVDVTGLDEGGQADALALLRELPARAPPGWRVEPVRAEGGHYVYARAFMCRLLGVPALALGDERVEALRGDVLQRPGPAKTPGLEPLRRQGVLCGEWNLAEVFNVFP